MTDTKKTTPPGSGNGNCPPGGTTPCPTTPVEETITVTLVTPGGDPVRSPNSTQGADGQNEFTYSAASPGVLTVKLKAKVEPSGKAGTMVSRVLFEVDPVGNSTMAWDAANPGGKPVAIGDFLEATVTFTTLPLNNSDFGTKTARLKLDGSVHQSNKYEVFFPRDATNHPGGQAGSPNWFYYWGQLVAIPNVIYGGAGTGLNGEVKGMTKWNYATPTNKTEIHLYDPVRLKSRSYGVGEWASGIDRFAMTTVHESKHVEQISLADPLVPAVRCWRHGYSWNKSPHNHWQPGPDGAWGPGAIATNAVPVSPPFPNGPGGGDDTPIDHPSHTHWPNTWSLPARLTTIHPIEGEAVEFADAAVNEHDYADRDWSDPGKNHNTLLKYDD